MFLIVSIMDPFCQIIRDDVKCELVANELSNMEKKDFF